MPILATMMYAFLFDYSLTEAHHSSLRAMAEYRWHLTEVGRAAVLTCPFHHCYCIASLLPGCTTYGALQDRSRRIHQDADQVFIR